jgi:hypothetical protein
MFYTKAVVATILTVGIGAIFSDAVRAQEWEYCDPNGAKFDDGSCMPPAGYNKQLPDVVRLKLYLRCEALEGNDGFEKTGCCDHVTDDIARSFKICAHATPESQPEDFRGIDFQTALDTILKVSGTIPE